MPEDKSIEDLQEELIAMSERAGENLAGWQRAQADYSNLVKDQDKKYKEAVEWANAMFMSEVLPVYNHFKLATAHIPEEQKKEGWVQGIIMIQKQFRDFLVKYKIEEIPTVGAKFDPNVHEALTHEAKEGAAEDEIFEEVAPGYLLDGKVLLPAKVKVAK